MKFIISLLTLIIVVVFLGCISTKKTSKSCQFPFLVRGTGSVLVLKDTISDSKFNLPNFNLEIENPNCFGEGWFRLYFDGKGVREEGALSNYQFFTDTLFQQNKFGELSEYSQGYYFAYKNGLWKYYNVNGSLEKTILYRNDTVIAEMVVTSQTPIKN